MRLGRRLGQRRATTGRARASSGPRRARRQSGGTDRRLTAERGLFGRSAEAEPHGQLSVERRRQRDHPLVAETYRLWGFDPEGGIPQFEALLQRIHPEDRGRFVDDLERAIREKANHEMIFRAVLPDGTLKYILGIGHPVFNASGDVVEFVGAAMDITERKRAEVVGQRLAAIVDFSEDAIVSKDHNDTIESWNGGAETVLFSQASENN